MLHLLLLSLSLTNSLLLAAPAGGPGRMPRAVLPADSIGRVVQNGKTYLKHKVGKGDSFYAIARKYGVPMDQLVSANPKVKGTLSIGQVVLVPRSISVLAAPDKRETAAPTAGKPAAKPARPAAAAVASPTGPRAAARTHVVASGQTLSAIARKYRVTIADLRRWNNLKNDNLRLKQRLVVSRAVSVGAPALPEAPAAVRDDKPTTVVPDEVAKVEAQKDDTRKEKEEERREEARADISGPAPRRAPGADAADDTTAGTEVAESLRKVTENGMAEVIESSGESTKFLALHRTAAVGSLLQVRNPQNSQSVYVRVIGKLPPTGSNENVIIRLSKRAMQKLQVVDARFRVEVSYMP
ncbi:MAG: LysM peptidoglycan-binding domain-containing protein [Hymenobacteraceae bacterium]|nr:LysM peptidoglycan-binding domain-containing protein [Hymenobacteraceae bacterium]